MTVQASDSFAFKRKKYVLIDVEIGKQMIDCAEFQLPEHEVCISSGCWRGYVAEYKVSNGKLYAIRHEWDNTLRSDFKSSSEFINYTGSCIIARTTGKNGWLNSDFLECYLHFDEALELHFTDGTLDEVIDLHSAIEEAKEYITPSSGIDEVMNPQVRGVYIEDTARKYLKYEYDYRTYKWRN